MVQTVEAWLRQGWVAEVDGQWVLTVAQADLEAGVAESLRQMIEEQFDRCSPEDQHLLAAASVVGGEFSAAAVAAGLETPTMEIEERGAALARRGQFVQARGVEAWPDGTVTERYGFLHTWYQQVIYDRLAAGRRVQLHRQIGAWEAAAYGGRVREHAAQVAMHFDRGRDYGRAAPFRQWAAEQALHRHAYHEATGHLTRGLEGLQTLPATPEHVQHELVLRLLLGTVLIVTKGYAAPDVERVYMRAQALWGLSLVHLARGELQTAHEMAEKLMAMAQNTPNPVFPIQRGHNMLGTTLFWRGEFVSARMHVEHTLALDEAPQPGARLLLRARSSGGRLPSAVL
jgi:predicted ATPase